MTRLPVWPPRTIAILATVGTDLAGGPHAVLVSSTVRADDRTILLSLHRSRDTLARLRERPQVALLVMADVPVKGDVAFTAHGTARVVAERMAGAPGYATVEITVTDVDDHRQAAATLVAGADRDWIEEYERRALGRRVQHLQLLAAMRRRCQIAALSRAGRT